MDQEVTQHEEEQGNQLTDMLDDILETKSQEAESKQEEESNEEAKLDEETSDEVTPAEDEKEEPVQEVSEEEVPVKADKKDDKEEVKEEPQEDDRSALLQELDNIAKTKLTQPATQEVPQKVQKEENVDFTPPPKPVEEVAPKQPTVARADAISFVSNDEYEDVVTDPTRFNEALNRVYDQAIRYMTSTVPQLVGNLVNRQANMRQLVDEFYKENSDLVPMKNYVGYVANELQAQHPDWPYDKLLKEVSGDVRKRLNTSKRAEQAEAAAQVARPAFAKKPGTKGRSAVEKPLNELEGDISELIFN